MDPDLFSTHSLLSNKISSRIRFVVFLFFFFFCLSSFFSFSWRDYSGLQPEEEEARRTENQKEGKKKKKKVMTTKKWNRYYSPYTDRCSVFLFFFVLFLLRHWYFSAQCNSKGRIVPLLLRFHRFLACLSHLVRIHLSDSWKGQENIKSSHQNFA